MEKKHSKTKDRLKNNKVADISRNAVSPCLLACSLAVVLCNFESKPCSCLVRLAFRLCPLQYVRKMKKVKDDIRDLAKDKEGKKLSAEGQTMPGDRQLGGAKDVCERRTWPSSRGGSMP